MLSAVDAHIESTKARELINTADIKDVERAILAAVNKGEFECHIYKPLRQSTEYELRKAGYNFKTESHNGEYDTWIKWE